MQFVSTKIREWEAGVIKIAYKVNFEENMAAGEGRVAVVSQACEREAGYTPHRLASAQRRHTRDTVGALSLQYCN